MGNKQSIYNVKYSNEINNEKNNINLLNSNSNLQGVDQEIFKRKKSGISQSDKLENITNINYYNNTPNHIEDHQENNNYLKKVRLNRACVYLWFCFVRRRKILDNILIDEVCDYKIYPIADNNTPQLSADRLEYTFSSGMSFTKEWEVSDVKEMYSNLTVLSNENNIIELGFKNKSRFLNGMIS